MARKTIAQTLKKQRISIFNSSKPQISAKLAAFGIDLHSSVLDSVTLQT